MFYLFRSGCTLEKLNENGEWIIKNEIILSWLEIGHLEELTNLYLSFTEGIEKFQPYFSPKNSFQKI